MKYGRPRIAWKNLATNSTLTATSSNIDFPVENILGSQVSKHWRSSSFNNTSDTIIGVLPSNVLIDCFHLGGININPGTGSIVVSLYNNTTATGTPIYTQLFDNFDDIFGYGEFGYSVGAYSSGEGYGRDWARNQVTIFLERGITIRSWKIEFNDPEVLSVGWFELGAFFLGMTWSPKYGITADYSAGFQSENVNLRSRSGFLASQDVDPYKIINVPLHMITDEEAAELYDVVSEFYSRTPILCGVFTRELSTEELMGTIYGNLVNPPVLTREAATRRFKTTLVIEEAK